MQQRKKSDGLARTLVGVATIGAALLCAGPASAALGGTAGVVIPYSGRLELDGVLVTGTANFQFGILVDPTTSCFLPPPAAAGTPAVIVVANVAVTNGEFALTIAGVPESCVKGKDVHLRIAVQSGGGAFVQLGTQRVTPLLSAMTSAAGDFAVGGEVSAASAAVAGQTSSGSVVTSSLNAGSANVTGNLTAGSATVSGLLTVGLERKDCRTSNATMEISGTVGICRCNGSGFVLSANALCESTGTLQLSNTTFQSGGSFVVTGRLCPVGQVTAIELYCARLR